MGVRRSQVDGRVSNTIENSQKGREVATDSHPRASSERLW